jgi:hypothetical protein
MKPVCGICKTELDQEDRPDTLDCGGDCLRCLAKFRYPDRVAAMREIEPENPEWFSKNLIDAAPVTQLAEQNEREAFETALRSRWTAGYACPRNADGTYVHDATQQAWEMWQEIFAHKSEGATNTKFFVYSSYHDGLVECETGAQRDALHNKYIEECLDDGEWCDEVSDIVSGVITHRTRESVEGIGESYQYDQEPLSAPAVPVAQSPQSSELTEQGFLDLADQHGFMDSSASVVRRLTDLYQAIAALRAKDGA